MSQLHARTRGDMSDWWAGAGDFYADLDEGGAAGAGHPRHYRLPPAARSDRAVGGVHDSGGPNWIEHDCGDDCAFGSHCSFGKQNCLDCARLVGDEDFFWNATPERRALRKPVESLPGGPL